MSALTAEYLLEAFELRDGIVFWRERPLSHFGSLQVQRQVNGRHAGKPVRFNLHGPYRSTMAMKRKLYEHRILWLLTYGELPKHHIDHINGDPSDNRIENLRDVPRTLNMRNAALRKDNTSGKSGVFWCKEHRKWCATILGRWLGYFDCKEEAIAARVKAERPLGYTRRHGRTLDIAA